MTDPTTAGALIAATAGQKTIEIVGTDIPTTYLIIIIGVGIYFMMKNKRRK